MTLDNFREVSCNINDKLNKLYSKLATFDKDDLVSVLTTLIYYDPILAATVIDDTLPYVTVLGLIHSLMESSNLARSYVNERVKELENENSETH